MKKRTVLIGIITILSCGVLVGCTGSNNAEAQEVQDGDTIKIDYVGTLEDGSVFNSSEGQDPLEFTVGSGKLIPGMDKAAIGMKVGETKTVVIPPEDAYGPVRQENIQEIANDQIPKDLNPEVGQTLELGQTEGDPIYAKVVEINDEGIKVDANHPLAGKTLTFEITLVEIL